MYPLEPPIEGVWPFPDFPEAVEIEDDTFVKTKREQPYEGVVAQYRQNVARDSGHLLVRSDGTYIIDHVDEYNPDMGHPVKHFLVDHPKGIATAIIGAGALGVMGSAVYGAAEKKGVIKKA